MWGIARFGEEISRYLETMQLGLQKKTDCQVTANKEGSGEVNKNITTKTRAFTTDKKEAEIENCKFQRKTRLIRVLHRCAHPPQATKFGHFVILFQKDGKVTYY